MPLHFSVRRVLITLVDPYWPTSWSLKARGKSGKFGPTSQSVSKYAWNWSEFRQRWWHAINRFIDSYWLLIVDGFCVDYYHKPQIADRLCFLNLGAKLFGQTLHLSVTWPLTYISPATEPAAAAVDTTIIVIIASSSFCCIVTGLKQRIISVDSVDRSKGISVVFPPKVML